MRVAAAPDQGVRADRVDAEPERGGELVVDRGGRLESTAWTATALGPPLGGAAISLLGPVTTVLADAVSFLLSAAGIRAIGATEPPPRPPGTARLRARDLPGGWRYILAHPALRPLFFNTVLVNGLPMATAPLVAVLMLGRLGFRPWQYGLAFGAPCVGGLVGSRLARRLTARYGQHKIMTTFGALRACWPAPPARASRLRSPACSSWPPRCCSGAAAPSPTVGNVTPAGAQMYRGWMG